MRWTRGERSKDIEDRRGTGGRVPGGAKTGGIVAVLIVLAAGLFFRKDLTSMFSDAQDAYSEGEKKAAEGGANGTAGAGESEKDKELVDFISFVLDDLQARWSEMLGARYKKATLVLYERGTETGCGYGKSAIGPFYCPADQKVYIDLSFYRDLDQRFGAPGDFAQAYILAHEIGHHVQNLLDVFRRSEAGRGRTIGAGQVAVRQELQADCFAGVWAHSTRKRDLLERGDLEEGLDAATAIGDDTLQKQSTGRVNPETWTHGSSAQRVRWFKRGMEAGTVEACDTYAARDL